MPKTKMPHMAKGYDLAVEAVPDLFNSVQLWHSSMMTTAWWRLYIRVPTLLLTKNLFLQDFLSR